jgi:hypothetical protein
VLYRSQNCQELHGHSELVRRSTRRNVEPCTRRNIPQPVLRFGCLKRCLRDTDESGSGLRPLCKLFASFLHKRARRSGGPTAHADSLVLFSMRPSSRTGRLSRYPSHQTFRRGLSVVTTVERRWSLRRSRPLQRCRPGAGRAVIKRYVPGH